MINLGMQGTPTKSNKRLTIDYNVMIVDLHWARKELSVQRTPNTTICSTVVIYTLDGCHGKQSHCKHTPVHMLFLKRVEGTDSLPNFIA